MHALSMYVSAQNVRSLDVRGNREVVVCMQCDLQSIEAMDTEVDMLTK